MQTNASTDGTYGKDTYLGLIARHTLSNPYTGVAPIALDDDRLVVDVLPTGPGTQTFTIAAQPDVPRNVIMTLTDGAGGIQEVNALVIGQDWFGSPIQERLIANAAGVITGALPFYLVESITAVTTGTIDAASRLKFGVGNLLGIPVRLGAKTDVRQKYIQSTQDTTDSITINAIGLSTWLPTTVPDAANVYNAWVKSTYGITG